MTGVSWFGVLSTLRVPPSTTSHAHPEPKRPVPAVVNCSRNFAKSPNVDRIASPNAPLGSPPALGAMICQNIE